MADEEKPKKEKKVTAPRADLVEAVKRHAAGKASMEDLQLIAGASPLAVAKARGAAGIKKAGGFRSTVDVWISVDGKDATRASKFGWKEFGALKKKVRETGGKIKMALVPAGQKP